MNLYFRAVIVGTSFALESQFNVIVMACSVSQALPITGHAVANTPTTSIQTAVTGSTNAADISLKTNECYSTNAVAMKYHHAMTSDIPLEANECYGTAATDGTTTIPVRSNECYGVVPATNAAQLNNASETDEYDYVLRQ